MRCGCCSRKQSEVNKLFERGKRKLTKDLDIERLLRTMHGFEALRSVVMNKQDRFFLQYQKQRVIPSDSESGSASSDSESG